MIAQIYHILYKIKRFHILQWFFNNCDWIWFVIDLIAICTYDYVLDICFGFVNCFIRFVE